jgi:hypothetical protein
MSLPVLSAPIKFHLSLNVADLGRSLAFYRVLFDRAPAKSYADYAKFELEEPPVVFSLVPRAAGSGGVLSHLGLRVADDEAIAAAGQRLQAAGFATQTQEGTVCGHARQNKCWTKDPDGNFWEVYTVEGDVDPPGLGCAAEPQPAPAPESGPVIWEHYVTEGVGPVAHGDGTVDEVRLTGTFNADLTEEQRRFLVGEAVRVLRPGGKVVTHGLMADRPIPGPQPRLPGLAALVARVPLETEPLDAFRAAGLAAVQVVKYTEQPWFIHAGAGLREVKVIAHKPAVAAGDAVTVVYKGPFAEARAEGLAFPRGRRVTVPAAVAERLRLGAVAEQFLFLGDGAGAACAGA